MTDFWISSLSFSFYPKPQQTHIFPSSSALRSSESWEVLPWGWEEWGDGFLSGQNENVISLERIPWPFILDSPLLTPGSELAGFSFWKSVRKWDGHSKYAVTWEIVSTAVIVAFQPLSRIRCFQSFLGCGPTSAQGLSQDFIQHPGQLQPSQGLSRTSLDAGTCGEAPLEGNCFNPFS